ncbi:Indoleamine 2,3-dioxygenase [Mytilinidion resinicola]|uniref:Indoleamine 2,3-dioxygenase n=1 Tax=Mytilinidion resinicola TaxID=574789 RepID=A0A6A6YRH4_9PEZI|nr:Indoleamine 2,3-dioxygenase [Mytilinidion resinicola]KAF2811371.1 Indoleamine 2,3-dioxygenase [Mytilinidion resinicola]
MQPPIPKVEDYGMSATTGFLPPKPPLAHLYDPYYAPWESIIANLPHQISSKNIRSSIHTLLILSTTNLTTKAEYQRAFTLLTFLAHAYIWGERPPAERLPAGLSIPLLEVSEKLDIPPTITYAALCLWNFRTQQGATLDDPANLQALHTFTATEDESWFYMISVAIEARGAPIIPSLLAAIDATRKGDVPALTTHLERVAEVLGQLAPLLRRMHERLSPQIFYHDIRPFLAGSRSLPSGLVYGVGPATEEEGRVGRYGGGSAAQSSLFQLCDVVLGVQHGDAAAVVVKEMRELMPGAHRRFLEDVGAVAGVREFVEGNEREAGLAAAYRACLEALKVFRNGHINVVTRYVVLPAKKEVKEGGEGEAKGTGGAPVIGFLKQMRDETVG